MRDLNKQPENEERKRWFHVSAWKKFAENCIDNLEKGDEVLITGIIQNYEWSDAQNYSKRSMYVIANDYKIIKKCGTLPLPLEELPWEEEVPPEVLCEMENLTK